MLHLHRSSGAKWVTPYEWSEEVNHAGEISLPAASASLCASHCDLWSTDFLLWGGDERFDCGDRPEAAAVTSLVQVKEWLHVAWKNSPPTCVGAVSSVRLRGLLTGDDGNFVCVGYFYVIKMWEDRNCCYKANRSPAVRSQTLPANKRAHQQTWHALEEQEIGGFLTSLYSV